MERTLKEGLERFRGRKITVMGLGLHGGGVGAVRFFAELGAHVTVTDLKGKRALAPSLKAIADLNVQLVLGRHLRRDFETADMVIVSPAVAPSSPYLEAARRAGVPIESPLNFFLRHCPAPVIGVTGTNGKSTTTRLLGDMLAAAGLRPYVGGNLGGDILRWLHELTPQDRVVLEISSFQLEGLAPETPSPRMAVFTRLYPHHLERHGDAQGYFRAKARILGGTVPPRRAVLNANDPVQARLARHFGGECLYFDSLRPRRGGVGLHHGWVSFSYKGLEERLFPVAELKLPGRFNLENAMAAAAAAVLEGCSPAAVRRAVQHFRGLPHRLEYLGQWGDVQVFNDSKATNPMATLAALETLPGPIVLILGGAETAADLTVLARRAAAAAKAVVCYGEGGRRAFRAIAEVRGAGSRPLLLRQPVFAAAVERALAMAAPGDQVVLSPAFPSFGQFQNFEERGRAFRAVVEAWARRTGVAARRAEEGL